MPEFKDIMFIFKDIIAPIGGIGVFFGFIIKQIIKYKSESRIRKKQQKLDRDLHVFKDQYSREMSAYEDLFGQLAICRQSIMILYEPIILVVKKINDSNKEDLIIDLEKKYEKSASDYNDLNLLLNRSSSFCDESIYNKFCELKRRIYNLNVLVKAIIDFKRFDSSSLVPLDIFIIEVNELIYHMSILGSDIKKHMQDPKHVS